ncbi:dipeptide ABC transporter ATP-binding protein [Krasilnikovia cinnamomea]|uniref:dipeptide ABC transporter ATP-binding protein n=1 Tax=Krasilnikovia cinnamomea TaxID=349313 RepID=UPI001F5E4D2D|nr:ABC transporter ATP-binding protein [Krasilnikovia cinnamomea]
MRDLRIAFGARVAVDGLSFEIGPGRSLGIVGESGSGKSATALALLGLHPTATVQGRVTFEGTELLTARPDVLRRVRGAGIAMVFQDPLSALSPFHTVGAQIAEVYRLHTGATRRAARQRAVEVLDQVHIADPVRRAAQYPHQFSGGMRQRALIAMALACGPRLIVADEPTTALDVTVQAQILDLLEEVRATTGTALLLVSHDLGVIAGSCDEVVVMRGGSAVEHGPVERVLGAPQAPYTRQLLAAVPRLDAAPRTAGAPAGAALLRLVDVRRDFPGRRRGQQVRAVDAVTLDVRRGETLGIVGESGTGKSTLARMMVGLLAPSSGTVEFTGPGLPQMVFQDPQSSLNPRRSVGDSVGGGRHRRDRVVDLLTRVGLAAADYDRYPHELSGGMRQRVAIARALAPRPALLVCDEPVSSLDVTTQAQVLALLAEIQREYALTIVFVSHDLAVVRQVADRVAVLRHGTVVELGDVDDVYARPVHPYTRELLAAVPVTDPAQARRRRAARRLAAGAVP